MDQHNYELCPNTVKVKNLMAEVVRLRDENAELKEKVTIGGEKTSQIFEILGEIKNSIKDIADVVVLIRTRADPFKDQVYKFGLKIAEWALIGGIIYMATQGKMP